MFMSDQITILFASANPLSASRLRLDEEAREIEAGISVATNRDFFNFISAWAVSPTDFQAALLKHQPDIVHISGHAKPRSGGRLLLQNRQGRGKLVSNKALTQMLGLFSEKIRIVFLNTCDSEQKLNTLVRQVDYAIGWSGLIGDKTAIAFAASFYQALAFGLTVNDAFELAKRQIQLAGLRSRSTPILRTRQGVDLSETLLMRLGGRSRSIREIALKLTPYSRATSTRGLRIALNSKSTESARGDKDGRKKANRSQSKRPSKMHPEFRDLLIALKTITEDLLAKLDETEQ